jgi:uncharacterized LabA/DUF88 family protein
LGKQLGRQITSSDIETLCEKLKKSPLVKGLELLRVYYYDAFLQESSFPLPVSKGEFSVRDWDRYTQTQPLFDELALKPDFAMRMGEVPISASNWCLKKNVTKALLKEMRPLTDDDFFIDAKQKGVDVRIGMDMARLALRQLVSHVVVVTADTDFVPAFKFVRREGLRVLLGLMNEGGRVELRRHSDMVIDC